MLEIAIPREKKEEKREMEAEFTKTALKKAAPEFF